MLILISLIVIVLSMMWKTVDIATQYEISEFGVVRRRIAGKGSPVGKILSNTIHHFGYPRVKLTIEGKHKTFEVHALVARMFLGEKPSPKHEVSHKDSNPSNAHYLNLEWTTHKENECVKKSNGTLPIGEKNPMAKFTEKDVRIVRQLLASGKSLSQIAKFYNVTSSPIWRIKMGMTWKHVVG